MASFYRYVGVVKVLVAMGADLEIRDEDGNTALMTALGNVRA